jgi:hypothetical protein
MVGVQVMVLVRIDVGAGMVLLAAAIAITATVLVMDTTVVHRQWSAGGKFECVCAPLLPPMKQEGGGREKCDPHDIRPGAVMHCMTGQGQGYFEVQPEPGMDHLGGFVRINGGVVDTRIFQPRYHHENSPTTKKGVSWRSSYSICRSGNYSGAVYVYIQGRGAESILINNKSCLINNYLERPALFFWEERSFAPRCSSLWYWDGGSVASSNSSDLSVINQVARRNYSLSYSDLRISLPDFDFARNTLAGNQTHEATTKDICLFGDSQTRHLHNSIASKLSHGWPCNRLGKQKCNARGLSWRWLRWGIEVEIMRLEQSIANCSHVFVNYGQWPFGYTSRPTPWTYERYQMSLKRTFKILLRMQNRRPGLKITWLSTSPHPPDWRQTDCPMVDWRVPHIIHDINEMAWELVKTTSGRISYLDIFGIIFPVFDLSFDRNHYQDMVGDAVANALAHCVHGSCFRGNQLDLGQNRGSGPV